MGMRRQWEVGVGSACGRSETAAGTYGGSGCRLVARAESVGRRGGLGWSRRRGGIADLISHLCTVVSKIRSMRGLERRSMDDSGCKVVTDTVWASWGVRQRTSITCGSPPLTEQKCAHLQPTIRIYLFRPHHTSLFRITLLSLPARPPAWRPPAAHRSPLLPYSCWSRYARWPPERSAFVKRRPAAHTPSSCRIPARCTPAVLTRSGSAAAAAAVGVPPRMITPCQLLPLPLPLLLL